MDKENLKFYYETEQEDAKLIYTTGFLWGKINAKLDEILAPAGLNLSKFNILMIIKHVGKTEGIQQNEISRRLLVTASNITKLLDKLEKDGLIIRTSKEGDRRVKLIKITSDGSNLLDKIWTKYTKTVKKIMNGIAPSDADYVNKVLLDWLGKI